MEGDPRHPREPRIELADFQKRMPERAKYALAEAIGNWLRVFAETNSDVLAPSTIGTQRPAHATSKWAPVEVDQVENLVFCVKIHPKDRAPRYLYVTIREGL